MQFGRKLAQRTLSIGLSYINGRFRLHAIQTAQVHTDGIRVLDIEYESLPRFVVQADGNWIASLRAEEFQARLIGGQVVVADQVV